MGPATINRFPILRGFDLSGSANRLSQSRGQFSVRPPNSSMSFRETLRDVHAISSRSHLRPGLETITSLPRERACKMFSCALSQPGSASLRHRCIASKRLACCPLSQRLRRALEPSLCAIGRSACAEATAHSLQPRKHSGLERVTRVELATFSLATRRSTTELHPQFCAADNNVQPLVRRNFLLSRES